MWLKGFLSQQRWVHHEMICDEERNDYFGVHKDGKTDPEHSHIHTVSYLLVAF